VAAARVLAPLERLRLFERLARRDADEEVQAAALDLLGREGDAGATILARFVRTSDVGAALRAQALRLLVDVDPARAGDEASGLLGSVVPADARLRRACLQALGAPAAAGRAPGRTAFLLDRALERDRDLACRARAAWSRAGLSAVDSQVRARLLCALGATLGAAPPTAPDEAAAQRILALAAARAGLPRPVLEALLGHPGLSPDAARALGTALRRP
jgi:hypothetical protein